jgi:hypothetical protein
MSADPSACEVAASLPAEELAVAAVPDVPVQAIPEVPVPVQMAQTVQDEPQEAAHVDTER